MALPSLAGSVSSECRPTTAASVPSNAADLEGGSSLESDKKSLLLSPDMSEWLCPNLRCAAGRIRALSRRYARRRPLRDVRSDSMADPNSEMGFESISIGPRAGRRGFRAAGSAAGPTELSGPARLLSASRSWLADWVHGRSQFSIRQDDDTHPMHG